MATFFDSYDKLFNYIIKINSENPFISQFYNFPISNKYYITILDETDKRTNKIFKYIENTSREVKYPFEIEDDVPYEFALEEEQFYKINLFQTNIKELDANFNEFIELINDSNSKVILIIDINYVINFLKYFEKNKIPNHFIDYIVFKLKKYPVENICIIDNKNIMIEKNNMFIKFIESTSINFNSIQKSISFKQLLNKKIIVIKPKSETVIENIYWKILDINSTFEKIEEIQSPIIDYDTFDIIKIDNIEYFSIEITLNDIFYNNIFELDGTPNIVLHPLEKLKIF